MKQLLLLLLASVLLAGSCTKYHPKDIRQVLPVMPVSITPTKDTFNVNDTLTFEIDIPETLRDSLSGQLITCKNFNFASALRFRKLIDPNKSIGEQQPNGADYQIISTGIGTIQSPPSTTFANFNLQYQSNRYRIKATLIVKNRGVMTISPFYLGSEPGGSSSTMGTNGNGETIYASFDQIKYFINNGQTNFHIYKQHCREVAFSNDADNWIENTGTFTFVVR